MKDMTRRDAVKLGAATGAMALAGSTVLADQGQPQAKQQPTEPQARGSAKMLAEMHGKPYVVDDEQLRSLLDVLDQEQVRVVDWCPYGQPDIDGVCGTLHVRPGRLGGVLDKISGFEKLRSRFRVFPKGQPPPIEFFEVGIDIGRTTM